jgi:GrpB-like predicted nucleotidyltransferase (UPF0157 family)
MADQRVEIVAPDPIWLQRFAEQRDAVQAVLGTVLAGPVQHVGSTSVPGLPAKPVVDLLAPVRSLERARELVPDLSADGWLYWPDDPNGHHRLWFLRPAPEARTHHLQVIEADDPHASALLAFRDALRADERLRDEYAALKISLAERHPDDRNAYTEAKGDFVDRALRAAGVQPPPRSPL